MLLLETIDQFFHDVACYAKWQRVRRNLVRHPLVVFPDLWRSASRRVEWRMKLQEMMSAREYVAAIGMWESLVGEVSKQLRDVA